MNKYLLYSNLIDHILHEKERASSLSILFFVQIQQHVAPRKTLSSDHLKICFVRRWMIQLHGAKNGFQKKVLQKQKTKELQIHKVINSRIKNAASQNAFCINKRRWHQIAQKNVQKADDILPNQRGYRWCLLPGRRRRADQLEKK